MPPIYSYLKYNKRYNKLQTLVKRADQLFFGATITHSVMKVTELPGESIEPDSPTGRDLLRLSQALSNGADLSHTDLPREVVSPEGFCFVTLTTRRRPLSYKVNRNLSEGRHLWSPAPVAPGFLLLGDRLQLRGFPTVPWRYGSWKEKWDKQAVKLMGVEPRPDDGNLRIARIRMHFTRLALSDIHLLPRDKIAEHHERLLTKAVLVAVREAAVQSRRQTLRGLTSQTPDVATT